MSAHVLLDMGNIPHTHPLSGCFQRTYRRSDFGLHPHDSFWILWPWNLATAHHGLSWTPLLFWISRILRYILGQGSLGPSPCNNFIRSPRSILCYQRRQSSPERQPSSYAGLLGVDPNGCIHVLHRRLAILAILDSDARQPLGPLLLDDVFRLRQNDNKDHSRPSHSATISLLDRHAHSPSWWSNLG